MLKKQLFLSISSAALSFIFVVTALGFQDSTLEDIKYKDDYDKIQRIIKIKNLITKSDQILALYKERPDMDQKLKVYIDSIFLQDLENMLNQRNFIALRNITERAVAIRPQFGEVYLYQGTAFKSENKLQEAIDAFAKCYVVTNPLKNKAKLQLDLVYRAANKGSLIGEEKVISKAANAVR
jgi:hypothetical protein